MCNQEEKCQKMRMATLRVLTEHLKKEKEAGAYNKCRNIIDEIKGAISAYACAPFSRLEEKISEYQKCQHLSKRIRIIDTLIAELEALLEN